MTCDASRIFASARRQLVLEEDYGNFAARHGVEYLDALQYGSSSTRR